MRKFITFRLMTEKKEGTWTIKGGSAKKNGVAKFINYWPGSNSIFDEDNKDSAVKPLPVVFRYNDILSDPAVEIVVPEENVALVNYLKAHNYFNIHYKIHDEDAIANEKLASYDLIEEALATVNDSDDVKVQAIAMAVLGQQTLGWSAVKCRTELKKRAFEDTKKLMDELNSSTYTDKYIIGLSILRGFIKVNDTNTAIVWTSNDGVLIRVAVGEDPISELAKYLATNSEEAIITKQKLGTLAEQSNTAVAQEKVVEAPKAPDPIVEEVAAAPVVEKVAKVEEIEAAPAPVVEEAAAEVEAPVVEEAAPFVEEAPKERTIQAIQAEYKEVVGKDAPISYKTNIEWMEKKIAEAKASKE